jgi:hypothetical protein
VWLAEALIELEVDEVARLRFAEALPDELMT